MGDNTGYLIICAKAKMSMNKPCEQSNHYSRQGRSDWEEITYHTEDHESVTAHKLRWIPSRVEDKRLRVRHPMYLFRDMPMHPTLGNDGTFLCVIAFIAARAASAVPPMFIFSTGVLFSPSLP